MGVKFLDISVAFFSGNLMLEIILVHQMYDVYFMKEYISRHTHFYFFGNINYNMSQNIRDFVANCQRNFQSQKYLKLSEE